MEIGCQQHHGERRPKGWREQVADFEEEPFQPSERRLSPVQDLQDQGAPGGVALLSGVLVQEGHLRHVREEDAQHQELQAELNLEPIFLRDLVDFILHL